MKKIKPLLRPEDDAAIAAYLSQRAPSQIPPHSARGIFRQRTVDSSASFAFHSRRRARSSPQRIFGNKDLVPSH